ncbi:MAG: hypothetical protein V7756_06465 [Halopseudomonas sp.]|uniref:hypothetical protein n=1 Tax=Halopseudomonas sp. TaxID=2901191 RepID=UPI0030029BB6
MSLGLLRKYKTQLKARLQGELRYCYYKMIYRNPGRPGKELLINISDIRMVINDRWLSRQSSEYRRIYKATNSVIGGEFWEHVKPVTGRNVKLLGFREHFLMGVAWQDTSLFKHYAQELLDKPSVQGCNDLNALIRLYEGKYDSLYQKLAVEGIKSARHDAGIEPIYIYIHADGSFVYTSGGNHRLNMAKVLGLKNIPVLVRGRHLQWQRIRDEYKLSGHSAFQQKYPSLVGHPDLQDSTP